MCPKQDHMQKLCPREVDVSTNHLGAHNTFGVSSSRVRVLMFRVFSSFFLGFMIKGPFQPLCNQLFANEHSRHLFLFRDKLPPF
jgi:hypothetical protein